jgi:hypothetical protein
MIDANRIESGNTSGIILGIANNKNLRTRIRSRSFPASSEMKSQTVCRMKMKNRITNTEANVVMNVFKR